jgi:hypothetical protein
MKKFFPVLGLSVFLLASAFVPVEHNTVTTERFKANFNRKNGMFDGTYVSYYPGGIKKAQGQFLDNQRSGTWSVWDSTGRLVVKRVYKNDYEFKQILPASASPGAVQPSTVLIRSNAGFYSYSDFKQNDVIYSKRTWRIAENDEESSFFGNDKFYHALIDSVAKGKIAVFDPSSDELTIKLPAERMKKLADTAGKEIIGFKIKEDWFFDKQRKTAERRIVCICPVVCKKDTARMNDDDYSFDMGWIYFPAVRNTLGAIGVERSNYPATIETLDDVFFFRYFPGEIYRETNIKNLELKDLYTRGALADAQLRIEIELIETEHDLWMKYSN